MTKVPATAHFTALLGSGRGLSNTGKVLDLLAEELRAAGAVVDVVDPKTMQLEIPGLAAKEAPSPVADDLKQRVRSSLGVVMVTPEYDGSYSAIMKILIEYLGYPSVLEGKPVLIVGVASGRIGASRAIEHLRAVCLHVGAVVMPGMKSVAEVHKFFDAHGRPTLPPVEAMLRGAAQEFLKFSSAF